jgi:formamidopyrimidine-DNA glycosylase
MPELPDVVVYIECLERRVVGQELERVRIASPFVLRSADPPIGSAEGKTVRAIRRLGKRIVFALEDDLHLVLHLMIAGRLAWADRGAKIPGKIGLAALDFTTGTLLFREASTKKRASMHLVRGEDGLRQFDRGGLEVLTAKLADFRAVLARENHTLKRAPGNPYWVEVPWRTHKRMRGNRYPARPSGRSCPSPGCRPGPTAAAMPRSSRSAA